MMAQYMETKKQYSDCILFYRLGDFYEMFFDDALTASRELEITLTGKDRHICNVCFIKHHFHTNIADYLFFFFCKERTLAFGMKHLF